MNIGPYALNANRGELSLGSDKTTLSPKATEVLLCLASTPGEVVSRETIHEQVWAGKVVTDAQISKAILELRIALDDTQKPRQVIETLPRRGYRLLAPVGHTPIPTIAIGLEEKAHQIPSDKPWLRASIFALVLVGLGIGSWILLTSDDSVAPFRPLSDATSTAPSTNKASSAGPVIRVELQLDGWEDWKAATSTVPSIAISADGKYLVFAARDSAGLSSLKLRRLTQLDTVELPGTEGAEKPFFSPDGKWIGYVEGNLMKRIALEGGLPSIITRVVGQFEGASWGSDDRIYYGQNRAGLGSISVSEGEYRVETRLDLSRGEGSHRLPHYLPDHELMLFSIYIDDSENRKHETWVLNLKTGEQQYLFDGLAAAFVDSGYITYAKPAVGAKRAAEEYSGSLWAVPFNPDAIELTGPPRTIQNATAGREGSAYAVSRSGVLTFMPKQGEKLGELVLLESHGSKILADGPSFEHPQFSNDGKSIAVTVIEEGNAPSVWVYGIESKVKLKVADNANHPLWDSDDQRLTFAKIGTGLVRQPLRDTSGLEILVPHEQVIIPDAWIRQNNILLYHAVHPDRGILVHTLEADQETNEKLNRQAAYPNLTSDEQWVAFCTWPSGIQVGSYPEVSTTTTLTDSGCIPHWGNNDTRIYYQNFNTLLATSVEKNIGQGPVFGEPEFVADLGYPGLSLFDVDPGGRVVIARHKDTAPKPPVLLINWESKLN